jgi:predicted DNA repair protein MutK
MSTAIGILLFALVYGRVAYIVYEDVTGGRSRRPSRLGRSSLRRGINRLAPRTH